MPLSDDDKALFQSVMSTVKPLHTRPRAPNTIPAVTFSQKPHKLATPQISTPYLSNNYPDTVHTETILNYHRNLSKKQIRELKNGLFPIQARLDLHGLTLDGAQASICSFVEQQEQLLHRHLLIIHGKGSRHGEAPVLKNHVNHWLKQLPSILAFHSAQPYDGGAGAVYVLLKRQQVNPAYACLKNNKKTF